MRIAVFTLFPDAVTSYCAASILGRAQESGALGLDVHDLRQGSLDTRRTVDDSPFGGGPGMVLMPEPVFRCVEAVEAEGELPRPLLLLAPGGRPFSQSVAAELAALPGGFSLLCGRYEGVDQRVSDHLVDGELSVGDFVLAGGELGALVVIETVARLLPEVLGNEDSALDESFSAGLLEYPQYTRPAEFRGWEVPGGAALGRPRRRGGLAPPPVPVAHGDPAARPPRAPAPAGRPERRRRAVTGRARLRCSVRH